VQYNLPATSSANGGEINYRYDRIGNMLAQSSDITHVEDGLSVTDLGTMAYGGAAGPTNRVGRQPNDPPGPHALSSVQRPASSLRSFPYDANGNMTNIDGLKCTWDFKDRLVEVEDDAMRAEYRYDFTDRRILKRVWPKPSTNSQPATLSPKSSAVIYPDKHFEVREDDAPTKYVFNGSTRVAHVTGSLSANTRIQRLRLYPGWNLASLAITATNALRQMTNSQLSVLDSQASFRWNQLNLSWVPVSPDETIAAGTILWLLATTNATLALSGIYTDPTNRPITPAGTFLSGAGFEAWNLLSIFDAHPTAAVWHFGSPDRFWQQHIPSSPVSEPNFPEVLAPGHALFIHAEDPVELEVPEAALRVRFYHEDHLGSSSVMTDADGALVEETAYYPCGVPRTEHRLRQIEESYKFTQKERDRESNLHYFETRHLAGALSRFISIDRKYANSELLSHEDLASYLAQPQKLNLYAYGQNNPIRFNDPDGRDTLAAGVEVQASPGGPAGSVECGVVSYGDHWYSHLNPLNLGIYCTAGAGVGTPGASATGNLNYNPGGRDDFEGPMEGCSVSGGEAVVVSGGIQSGTGKPTYTVGAGIGGGPPVGVTCKATYTKSITVGDVGKALFRSVNPWSSVPALSAPNVDIEMHEEVTMRSSYSAHEDPPPPPRPQPKHAPPPPRRVPRPSQECWTRGVPP
jgi:RHS repeat-associated protein